MQSEYWFSAPIIADLTGKIRPGVLKRIKNHNIPGRKRAKGKGLEYNLADLPADWQAIICAKLGIDPSALAAEAGAIAEERYTAPVSSSVGGAHPALSRWKIVTRE